jgi:uncharacterized membrane protein
MNAQTPLRVALLMWVGSLFALLGLQRFFVAPLASFVATLAVFVAELAPLLMVTPLALRSDHRGPLWVCLVSILYFVHGVWQWSAPDVRVFGVLEVIFAVGAFVTALILVRLMPREDAEPD